MRCSQKTDSPWCSSITTCLSRRKAKNGVSFLCSVPFSGLKAELNKQITLIFEPFGKTILVGNTKFQDPFWPIHSIGSELNGLLRTEAQHPHRPRLAWLPRLFVPMENWRGGGGGLPISVPREASLIS